jgi:hypothetical protein
MPRHASTNADDIDARRSQYAPEDFIIPSKDHKGDSVRVWNRIQPGHDRAVAVIVGSKRFPFKTPGDCVRWCIHRGLKTLEQMEPVPSVTQQLDAMMGALRDEEFHQEFQTFIQHAQSVIQRHVTEGSHGEARRLIATLKAEVLKMPKGYWREKYLTAIQSQFKHILDEKRARVHLLRAVDEDES